MWIHRGDPKWTDPVPGDIYFSSGAGGIKKYIYTADRQWIEVEGYYPAVSEHDTGSDTRILHNQ